MEKIKYSVALPLLQLLIAAALWKDWSQSQPLASTKPIIVYYGINAPALAFKALGFPLRVRGGFWLEQVLFFMGVTVVWYLVGKVFDRIRWNKVTGQTPKLTFAGILGNLLIFAAATAVFVASVTDVDGLLKSWKRGEAAQIFVILMLAWCLILIAFSGSTLLRRIRRMRSHQKSPGIS